MKRDELLSLYQFSTQANETVLGIVAQLSAEAFTRECSPSHGTVRQMLIHMLGGEVFFPATCQGREVDLSDLETLQTLDDIGARFRQASADTEAFIASLDEADLDREVTITFGEYSFRLKLWQVMMQSLSHSHHHRGELSILLTELGHPLPTIDLMIHFIKQSGQEWPFGSESGSTTGRPGRGTPRPQSCPDLILKLHQTCPTGN